MLRKMDSEWYRIHHRSSTMVDLHAHPSLKVSLFKRALTSRFRAGRSFDPFGVRTDFASLREGGISLLLSTVYAPEKEILKECWYLNLLSYLFLDARFRVFNRSYFDVTMKMLDAIEEQVKKANENGAGEDSVKMIKHLSELDEWIALGPGRPLGVIHNIEGAHSLDGKSENVEELFKRGVAYMTLAHFYENEAAPPCFPYPESLQKCLCFKGHRDLSLGLTDFGREVVDQMLHLGMIIDVTHCTPPARKQIYDMVGTRAPIIASHVGAYEVNPSPYNMQNWEIRKIADSGGVVGVIFMNYWLMPHETKRGINFITRTINHIVKVAGIEHVAIGTDFDGFTDPPDDLRDASQLNRLTQRLIAEGYSEDEIAALWGDNVLRVLRAGWKR